MRSLCALLFLFFCFIDLDANNIQVVKDGPIHEAFVTQEYGNIILEAVPDKPPLSITEETPYAGIENAIWIPGYWAWLRDPGSYIWVSGVWRKPPHGHQWIHGRWKNYQFGWVWMKGFWSKVPESEIAYISEPPPDPIDENIPPSPLPVDTYFWVPGYWTWLPDSQTYQWLSGRWTLIGERVVYIPAHYYWHEKGYFFVPGFWDWTLEDRGVAYANVSIPEEEHGLIVFEPSAPLNALIIIEKLFPHWPNYPSLFRYHFYNHYDAWISWGAIPPWWQWYAWWCLPIQDSWWLWWWWTHDGYPNPSWLTAELAEKIIPPNDLVLKIMKNAPPPPVVTANGAIGSKELIEAIEIATGKKNPILSSDPKQVEQVQDLADPNVPRPPYLRPTGQKKRVKSLPKPSTGEAAPKMKLPPFSESELLKGEGFDPFAPQNQSSRQNPAHTPYYIPKSQPADISNTPTPQPTPRAHTPYYYMRPTPRAIPRHPGHQVPEENLPHPDFRPPPNETYDETTRQGYQPYCEYPQTPMQTQHLDDMMTQPQPQVNPSGPNCLEKAP